MSLQGVFLFGFLIYTFDENKENITINGFRRPVIETLRKLFCGIGEEICKYNHANI